MGLRPERNIAIIRIDDEPPDAFVSAGKRTLDLRFDP
jgi:hypothetical protein